MLALADRLTVPQVFFNDEHIGGADDTLAVLEQWDKEAKYATALERYEKEIASVENAPSDVRLEVPTTPPVQAKPEPPRSEDDLILLPNGEEKSILEVTQLLVKGMPRSNLSYLLKVYMNVFTGEEGVDALMKMFQLQSREEAIIFGQLFQKRKLLNHVADDHKFQDTSSFYYRLQAFQEPKVLNTYRIWTDRVDPDSMALLARLKKLMGKIESDCTDDEGYLDYVAAKEHPKYDIFEEAACELQGVNFKDMAEDEKLAFGINLYNLVIKHAFMKVGIPSGVFGRALFFTSVGYNIGGDFLSFSDLENGVLRGNKKAPGKLSQPFSSSDRRSNLALSNVDARIHFALNCGAKSCPPVKKFTSQAINEELRIVAQAFCEQDDNVGIDEANSVLSLSKILSWYRSDFATSTSELPGIIVTFLRGEKRKKLQRMIDDSGKAIKVTFNDYDWGTNASKSEGFSKEKLVLEKFGLAL